MPTTSWGFRYPSSSAAPNVNQDIQNLANDVQTFALPRFASIAARNAALPSPLSNQACIVNGTLHSYDGSAWRFVLYGETTGTTDASGILQIAHGGGQNPLTHGGTPAPQSTEGQNQVINIQSYFHDSTFINFRINRTDSLAVLATTTITVAWWAKF